MHNVCDIDQSDLFEVISLPYQMNALEPYMSQRTVEIHHTKHEFGYARKLKRLYQGSLSASEIVQEFHSRPERDIYNNAGQLFNHNIYWRSLIPSSLFKAPSINLMSIIDEQFGSFDSLVNEFIKKSIQHFGSGWVWLVAHNGKLEVIATANADSPLTMYGYKILIGLDIWEHSYYLDYTYERDRFVETMLKKLVNWEIAEIRLNSA